MQLRTRDIAKVLAAKDGRVKGRVPSEMIARKKVWVNRLKGAGLLVPSRAGVRTEPDLFDSDAAYRAYLMEQTNLTIRQLEEVFGERDVLKADPGLWEASKGSKSAATNFVVHLVVALDDGYVVAAQMFKEMPELAEEPVNPAHVREFLTCTVFQRLAAERRIYNLTGICAQMRSYAHELGLPEGLD